MKKSLLAIVAIIAMHDTIKTQITDVRDRLMPGFKVGTNFSNVYDQEGEAFVADPKFGMVIGGFLSIPIGKYLGIQPEVLFSQKGFQATGRLLGESYELKRTTNFVDVPILFALKPTGFLTLLAGPQYSYLTKQKDVFVNGHSSTLQEQAFRNDNPRKNILCFVGGVDITLRHNAIGLRAGWDVQKNNGDGTSATPRYKNVWYQLTIGYRFY